MVAVQRSPFVADNAMGRAINQCSLSSSRELSARFKIFMKLLLALSHWP